ncbi:hypothetical protein B0H12DRAFT_1093304 [Mycena haematopus]|nr:hypothetical protein B0H12DRAFT_1093304 [Mycena haematopus]
MSSVSVAGAGIGRFKEIDWMQYLNRSASGPIEDIQLPYAMANFEKPLQQLYFRGRAPNPDVDGWMQNLKASWGFGSCISD